MVTRGFCFFVFGERKASPSKRGQKIAEGKMPSAKVVIPIKLHEVGEISECAELLIRVIISIGKRGTLIVNFCGSTEHVNLC